MRRAIIFILLLLSFFLTATQASADEKLSAQSASFKNTLSEKEEVTDNRAKILERFLETQKSPLSANAASFITHADRHNIDWKLVAAISGVESTFGLAVPYNCNNAWGYNIYAGHVRCFSSYDEAINVISYDLRELYMKQWGASDIYSLGRFYAADPFWATKVEKYLAKIETFAVQYNQKSPTISL